MLNFIISYNATYVYIFLSKKEYFFIIFYSEINLKKLLQYLFRKLLYNMNCVLKIIKNNNIKILHKE